MSKRIFGLLLVLCMIVGLLPITAMAANGTATIKFGNASHKLTGYDKPIYTKNASAEAKDTSDATFTYWYQTAGSVDDWNAKIEWKSGEAGPTITLKGFKMDDWNSTTGKLRAELDADGNFKYFDSGAVRFVQTYSIVTPKGVPTTILLTGEDSYIGSKFGITYYDDLTIKSEGNTKLTIKGQSSGISSNNTQGADLTIDANLDVSIDTYYNTAYGAAMLQAYNADLTINGGNIKVDTPETKQVSGIAVRGTTGNIIINGGTIKATSVVGTSPTSGTINAAGKVIVNGGDVTSTPKFHLGMYGKKGIEVNGGKVSIVGPYYGVNAGTADEPADIVVNGGTVEIIAERAFYKAPKLGSKVAAYAGANRENCEVFDGSDANLAKKPWMLISETERIEITEPEEEELPAFTGVAPTTPAATSPTTPAGSATTAPTIAPTADSEGGSNTTVWIVVAAVVVIAGAAVAIILIKRKKA